MGTFQHILVTTDFSEIAEHGVTAAFELARCSGAKVTLCHVLEATSRPNPMYAHYAPVESVPPELAHNAEVRAEVALRSRIPADLAAQASVAVTHGAVAEEILHLVETRGCDLVVISTHGHTGLLERLMGGVADRVVRHAKCPVLVMR